MNNLVNKTIEEILNKDNYEKKIEKEVVDIINDNCTDYDYEDKIKYLKDVVQYGCVSGTVTGMIYYYETEAFFKKYFNDIFDLYNEVKEECGQDFLNCELNANNLTWFAVETITQKILLDNNIDF